LPANVLRYYDISFKKSKIRQATIVHDSPEFDWLRASANLVLASAIIALATSYKLPLSTTYVSFMVAMGTSLADKAWGRETAVYRVAGVLSVIGGWFITAIIAFVISALFALILIKGGIIGTIILLAFVTIYIIFSHWHFAHKSKAQAVSEKRIQSLTAVSKDLFGSSRENTVSNVNETATLYSKLLKAIRHYDEEQAKDAAKAMKELDEYSFKMKAQTIRNIKQIDTHNAAIPQVMLYSADLSDDIFKSLGVMGGEITHYIQNLHEPPEDYFIQMSEQLESKMKAYLHTVTNAIDGHDFSTVSTVKMARDDAREFINTELNKAVQFIQHEQPGTRQALLRTTVLLQSRDIVAVTYRLYNLYRKYLSK